MQQISQNLQSIYRSYRAIPLVLSAAVVIDYALTFYLAGGIERILKYEYSPTLVYAVEHDLVIPYLVFTVFFYYAAGYNRAEISSGFRDLLHRRLHHPADEYHACSWRAVMVCLEHTLLKCGACALAHLCCGHDRGLWI